ncbi:protein LYRIC-like [Gadus macrocephalus]|uniref:protein LYRIC-like n=1 Tax=Gadus macrocephalus TaxID=80720 RepID=UPI0028CB2137|nr:protein LYRIC-like [Gadus macrocephalus]
MATNLQALAFEKAELLSSRLKEIISSGQGYIQNQLGLDLGLNLDVYPTWVLLSTAAAGLLVVLVLSWVAICGGASVGKTRGSSFTKVQVEEPLKADLNNSVKPDDQKRKNKKKSSEKKGQSNGRQFSAPHDDTASRETSSQQPPAEKLPVKLTVVQVEKAPVQVKKNKKKAKAIVRPVISVFTCDETEPDAGAWETQVSQRERKQQRKKDKGPEDAGSPGEPKTAPRTHVETPAPSGNRSRGPPGRKVDSSTNGGGGGGGGVGGGGGGGGRLDLGSKPPGPSASGGEREKWSSRVQRQRAQPEPKLRAQDKPVTRSGVGSRTSTGVKPITPQEVKAAEHASLPVTLQWDIQPDDEWCGLNTGAMAGDAGSDWSVPLVHWGHYEGPCSPVPLKGPSPKEVSFEEKVAEDSVGGTKSTKRKKKKNKTVDEGAATVALLGGTIPRAQEAPAVTSNKQSAKRPDSEKKSEQRTERLKPGQKKQA